MTDRVFFVFFYLVLFLPALISKLFQDFFRQQKQRKRLILRKIYIAAKAKNSKAAVGYSKMKNFLII